jgi:hypothetical protein
MIYYLARALFWMKDEENHLIAFAQAGLAHYNGCKGSADLVRGHHLCRECEPMDLCNECAAQYRDGSLFIPDRQCRGHAYFDASAAVLASSGAPSNMGEEEVYAWIDRLKEQYPLMPKD